MMAEKRKMKSTAEQLKHRGYVSDDTYEISFRNRIIEYRDGLACSDPCLRTATVRKIKRECEYKFIPALCELLKNEKALYTRLEICDCLSEFGNRSVGYLLPLIGKIGHNQHKQIGNYDLKKKSYPLPRDIVCRILVRIGPSIFDSLTQFLDDTKDTAVIAEVIDMIGHITYYHSDQYFADRLVSLYQNNKSDFICWKLIRAFRSFDSAEIREILQNEYQNQNNQKEIRMEAERSLQSIEERKTRSSKSQDVSAEPGLF